jgi:hypothetical protein
MRDAPEINKGQPRGKVKTPAHVRAGVGYAAAGVAHDATPTA